MHTPNCLLLSKEYYEINCFHWTSTIVWNIVTRSRSQPEKKIISTPLSRYIIIIIILIIIRLSICRLLNIKRFAILGRFGIWRKKRKNCSTGRAHCGDIRHRPRMDNDPTPSSSRSLIQIIFLHNHHRRRRLFKIIL